MSIGHIQSREAVLQAIEECDRLGQDAFLKTYGYGRRTKYDLVHEGQAYDPKAILGVAHSYEFPAEGVLKRGYYGGEDGANKKLRELGFTVVLAQAKGDTAAGTARNPNWARDELILALDLYLRRRPQLPGDNDPDVIELSKILNDLPIHTVRPDQERFRNPNGVGMKIANFAALDPAYPGKGLDAGARLDAEVWDAWKDRPDELAKLAATLRAAAVPGTDQPAPISPEEGEDEVEEGRIIFRLHRARERNQALAKKKKDKALASTGTLTCEACGFDFKVTYGPLGEGYIECHHVIPLAELGHTKTKLQDLALLCANCHRMAHRSKPWPTVEEIAKLTQTPH